VSRPRAVVLLSGGLDSSTTLAIACDEGFDVHALGFRYGQRHRAELRAARRVAQRAGVPYRELRVPLDRLGGSALTDEQIPVPLGRELDEIGDGIPLTYVPARNTVFLSLALAWAEVLESRDIFIGVNAVDFSGYPDCRPEFVRAFERMANLGTRAGAEGRSLRIHAPLLELSKAGIIRRGLELGVDYSLTSSCYAPSHRGLACGRCDACRLRLDGFAKAGVEDPVRYSSGG
jgi:7-cyano-7-deazaguanine synthase